MYRIYTDNKGKLILVFLIISLLWIIGGFNTDNADLLNYRHMYEIFLNERTNLFTMDFGYYFIQKVFALFNCSFEQYHVLSYGIAFTLLGVFCYKSSNSIIWVLLFYIFSHFIRDVVQIRNFFASIFILYSFNYLGRIEKKYFVLSMVMLTCAFSIHMSFILYFILLFTFTQKTYSYWKFYFICILISVFAKKIMFLFISLFSFDGLFDKAYEYAAYDSYGALMLASGLAFGNGIVINYFSKIAGRINNIKQFAFDNYTKLFNNANSLMCITLIFTTVNFSFYGRLFGNILLFNVIYLLNIQKIYGHNKFLNYGIILVYCIVFIYLINIIPFEYHFDLVMSNNSLLD